MTSPVVSERNAVKPLPCPFCGTKPYSLSDGSGHKCSTIGCAAYESSYIATETWNLRASPVLVIREPTPPKNERKGRCPECGGDGSWQWPWLSTCKNTGKHSGVLNISVPSASPSGASPAAPTSVMVKAAELLRHGHFEETEGLRAGKCWSHEAPWPCEYEQTAVALSPSGSARINRVSPRNDLPDYRHKTDDLNEGAPTSE